MRGTAKLPPPEKEPKVPLTAYVPHTLNADFQYLLWRMQMRRGEVVAALIEKWIDEMVEQDAANRPSSNNEKVTA